MNRIFLVCLTGAVVVLVLGASAVISPSQAIPPSPVPDGKGPSAARQAYDDLLGREDLGPGIDGVYTGQAKALPTSGTAHVPVLLVQYAAQQGQHDSTAFFNMLFPIQTYPTGSVNDYYREVSYAKLSVWGRVVGWLQASQSEGFYVNGGGGMLNTYPRNSQGLVREAIQAADASIDFRNFDNDGPDNMPNSGDDDGFVDCVVVVFCGYSAVYTANTQGDMWDHCWWLSAGRGPGPIMVDGVMVDKYTIQAELRGTSGAQIRDIGVFCHELGHGILNVPDLYSTCPTAWRFAFGDWEGAGCYDLMGVGCWGAGGTNPDRPFHLSGLMKAFLGWVHPIHVNVDLDSCYISCIETADTLFCTFPFWNHGGWDVPWPLGFSPPPDWDRFPPMFEGFVVENRQQVGFDSGLPGSGLLVYHVDGAVTMGDYDGDGIHNWWDNDVQWFENRPFLDLECPDQTGPDHTFNADDLDARNNTGDPFDFFYQGNPFGDVFDGSSNPSSMYYNGTGSQFAVLNVSASGTVMRADLRVGVQAGPNHDIWVKDCIDDDGSTPSYGNCGSPSWLVYTSRDVWVDNNQDGIADAPVGGPVGGSGCPNLLHVRVRNQGPQFINYAKVRIYDMSQTLAPPPPPPANPGNPFHGSAVICSTQVRAIAPAGSTIVKVWWTVPPSPPPPNFIFPPSIGVCVETSNDTLGWSGDIATENNLAMCTGKELWGKAGQMPKGALLASWKQALLESGGRDLPSLGKAPAEDPPAEPAYTVIPVNNPFEEERLITIDAEWGGPPEWNVTYFSPQLGIVVPPQTFIFQPLEVIELEVTVEMGPGGQHGDEGWVAVTEWEAELYGDPEGLLGSMYFPVEIDVREPLPVTGLAAYVIEDEPCIPSVRSVVLEWDPVIYDVSGLEENMAYYAIYRHADPDSLMNPDNVVAHVAIDAMDSTEVWEWVDVDWPVDVTGDAPWYSVIAVDKAENESEPGDIVCAHIEKDYMNHEEGSIRLTMTDQGILGYMEAGGRGSGLQYPKGSETRMWVGSLWAGSDPLYVANRDYEGEPVKDWLVAEDPDGYIYRAGPPPWMPEIPDHEGVICSGYQDEGGPSPHGWYVEQASLAWSTPPYDDFVIVNYYLRNQGVYPVYGLYLALFQDLDIDEGWLNNGDTDLERQMAFMWEEPGSPYLGLRLLSPEVAGNISFIRNDVYVYPDQYISDEQKYNFMVGIDPDHQLQTTPEAADWSVMVSAGPFDLDPGEETYVAFAVVAGDNLPDLLVNADAALEKFLSFTAVEGGRDEIIPTNLVVQANVPNPFNPLTEIRYLLPVDGHVKVDVFDVTGSRVATLVDRVQEAGPKSLPWNAEGLASGVYFVRVQAGTETGVRKMILLK